MRQRLFEWTVPTRGRGFYELTTELASRIAESGISQGLATLHLQHTSASLVIQENADPEVREDFERFFQRLVPDGDRLFCHTAEGRDDMPAHVRTVLTAVNLGIPIQRGRLALGCWQGVYLWEHRLAPHSRHLTLHVIGE